MRTRLTLCRIRAAAKQRWQSCERRWRTGAKHPQLRYCRISLFAQGTGACAAFMALHDHPEEFGYIVQLVSACEPTGDDDLTEGVISTYAPKCSVPVLLSSSSAVGFLLQGSRGGRIPQQRPPTRLKPSPLHVACPWLGGWQTAYPARPRVARCLCTTTPSVGRLCRIEGSRFLGDHPEQLFLFLEHHQVRCR